MKFWKTLLAVICGVLIVNLLIFFIITAAIGSAGTTDRSIPASGVLVIDLSEFVITEQEEPAADILSVLQGQETIAPVSIYKAVQAINIAAQDTGVQYIFLKTDGNTSSLTALGELRSALADFRKSGKAVIAYSENIGTGSYYLASVADKIYTTEYQGANNALIGLSLQSYYLKDLLDKLGVNVQLIRHGKYKSAGEMFIRNSPSKENKEQYQRLVDSMWESISATIAESRDIAAEDLDRMVNGLELCLPEDFEQKGLVDGVLTREGLKKNLASLAMADSYDEVQFIPFPDYADIRVKQNVRSRRRIAVIYVNGDIIDGQALTGVAGDRFASIIDEVRRNSKIEAVVLRVNSPGGSVLASEKIKHELDLLCAEKPVVASYGDYAASGGYWISNGCSRIFSNASTLTGSIGVFGLVPDFSNTLDDVLHIGADAVKSNGHADRFSLMRPFDKDEYDFMLRSIEKVYDKFTGIVAEGRGMEKEKVDEIGQGRVWTGADALEIGLVDEIGGLQEALVHAAGIAGDADLADWQIVEYPRVLTTIEMLMANLGESPEGHRYVLSRIKEMVSKPQVLARMPYQIKVF